MVDFSSLFHTASGLPLPALPLSADVSLWLEALREVWATAFQVFWRVVEFFVEHSPKIFGAAGLAFGVYKWWYTRESALHKRLQEYLLEQDQRLGHARADVLSAIHRPGPKREFADPLFAVKPLRNVLRQRRWYSLFDFGRIETSAERSLDKALVEIEHRLDIAVAALTSLRAQMASAHMLKGAIAAARASRRHGPQRAELDDRALIQFRTALQVHDHERDVQAKEYEAHQLRRLGHVTEADDAYEQLEGHTAWIADEKLRNLTLARARRYRALIAQARAITARNKGHQTTSRSPAANAFINGERGALALRAVHGPFRVWEAIEQGEMHYVSAFVCHHLEAVVQEPVQLSQAESMFRQVLNETPPRWFQTNHERRLRDVAQAGLDRVQRAQNNSDYDTDWLLPPSHQPQSPAAAISDAGGN